MPLALPPSVLLAPPAVLAAALRTVVAVPAAVAAALVLPRRLASPAGCRCVSRLTYARDMRRYLEKRAS